MPARPSRRWSKNEASRCAHAERLARVARSAARAALELREALLYGVDLTRHRRLQSPELRRLRLRQPVLLLGRGDLGLGHLQLLQPRGQLLLDLADAALLLLLS